MKPYQFLYATLRPVAFQWPGTSANLQVNTYWKRPGIVAKESLLQACWLDESCSSSPNSSESSILWHGRTLPLERLICMDFTVSPALACLLFARKLTWATGEA